MIKFSMTPCDLLYQAAGRPPIEGLLDRAAWQALKPGKKTPQTPPDESICYLTGQPIEEAALPIAARLKDATWTAHDTAAAPDSEWLSPAAVFCLSEKAIHPDIDKPFKMRSFTHLVVGKHWQPLTLRQKRDMLWPLFDPPEFPWFLAICNAPLSASHIIYQAPVNSPGSSRWFICLGGLIVSGSPDALHQLLDPIESLYRADHTKGRIGSGRYTTKYIAVQGEAAWAALESQIAPYRGSPLFELALFLAQKGVE